MMKLMTRLKKITSHTGLARFLNECSEDPVAYIPRGYVSWVKTPYRHTQVVEVYEYKGKNVIWMETAHKIYEVFDVTDITSFNTEEAAEDAGERLRDHYEDLCGNF